MKDKVGKRTRETGKAWRRYEAQSRRLVKELAQKELPTYWWLEVWRFIERRRQRVREYVRSEYGFELQRPEWLERLLVREQRRGASRDQIAALIHVYAPNLPVDPHLAFERFGSERDRDRFRAGCWSYTLYNGTRWHIQEACSSVLSAEGVGELELPLPPLPLKTTRALNQAVVNVLDRVSHGTVALAGDIMQLSPLSKEAEAAAYALAGFVNASLSGSKNRRRNIALSKAEQLDFLAGCVKLAWEKRLPDEPIYHGTGDNSLISRVDGMLEELGNEADALPKLDDNVAKPRRAVRDLGNMPPDEMLHLREPDADSIDVHEPGQREMSEFEAREEAARQKLDALEQAAELSSRETELWHRLREGMEYAEIAAELKMTMTNFYVTKHNAEKKIKGAEEAAGF
jgi:DNA-binding CsgD family transcriptional regulator